MTSYNSIWFHTASLFFTSIIFTSDVIKIRLLIIAGNVFMLLNALLGWPFYPDIIRKPVVISWDSTFWPIFNIIFNTYKFWKDYKKKNTENNEDDENENF